MWVLKQQLLRMLTGSPPFGAGHICRDGARPMRKEKTCN
jgi:hypothetical protein